jgi:hypothetical protein
MAKAERWRAIRQTADEVSFEVRSVDRQGEPPREESVSISDLADILTQGGIKTSAEMLRGRKLAEGPFPLRFVRRRQAGGWAIQIEQ